MKLDGIDLLVFAAHPDDAELSCAGAILSVTQNGGSAVIVDLTKGELGTRGTILTRQAEADAAGKILGLGERWNLGLEDGWLANTKENKLPMMAAIRHFRPKILMANALEDRHPDHGNAATLADEAWFLAGLTKIETMHNGVAQSSFRPERILHYVQDRYIHPDVVLDISPYMEQKIESVLAYKSQFYDPNSKEPETYISGKSFIDGVKARARSIGQLIGVEYGEGFTSRKKLGVRSLSHLI